MVETYLIHTFLQYPLLVLTAQSSRRYHVRLQRQHHDGVLERARAHDPVAAGVQLGPHRLDILAALCQDLRVRLQDVESLAASDGHHGGKGSREGVRRRGEALVLDYILVSGAEPPAGAQRAGQRPDDHVDLGGVDVLRLGESASGAAQHAERPGLVEHEAELVLLLELDELGEVVDVADRLEQGLSDDEAARQLLGPGLVLRDLLHDLLEVGQVVVIVPLDVAARALQTLADGVVDGLVGYNDVATLAKGRDYARDGREGLRVDNGTLGSEKGGDVGLELYVDVLGAVELRRSARADAVGPEGLDRLLLDLLVAVEVVEVIGCEVRDRTPVGELRFGSRGSRQGMRISLVDKSAGAATRSALPDQDGYFLRLALFKCIARAY